MANVRCPICESTIYNCTCEKPICPSCENELLTTSIPETAGYDAITHCDDHASCKNCGDWLHREGKNLYYDANHPEFCSEDCYNAYHGLGDYEEDHKCEWPDLVLTLELDDDGEILEIRADDVGCDCGKHIHPEDNEDKIRDKLVGEFLSICE